MLINRNVSFKDYTDMQDINKEIAKAKRLLPDSVFNMANLEGNPYTFPEVQTLLDGITVGGHKVSDQTQIFDIRNSWEFIFNTLLNEKEFKLNKELFNMVNKLVACNEALVAGEFRDGNVRIAGTNFEPPKAEELDSIFAQELPIIKNRCHSAIDLAFEIFLWGSLNQFYYDGNKRTSRLVANTILMSQGQGFINIKAADKLEFNTLMVDFYNTRNGDEMFKFLYNKCLE